MRRLLECLVLAAFSLTIVQSASAAVPASITVQGRLTDAAGVPLPAGPKSFNFKIFATPAGGGIPIWPSFFGEPQVLSSDASGLWIALMGAISPLTDAVFADTVRWLEVTVDGVTLPRVRLATGPYAHRVATVDGASGGTITSKVSIGPGHTNTGADAFVAGETNTVSGESSTVPGGKSNIASGDFSAVSGGEFNEASGQHASVGGGLGNYATDSFAFVGGGSANAALAEHAVIGGGHQNFAEGVFSSIGSGLGNHASDSFAHVGGGYVNLSGGVFSTIGGGDSNIATGDFSTVSGGETNEASGNYSRIGGGKVNIASGSYSSVSGGVTNEATGHGASVGGGVENRADDDWAVVAGGNANSALATNSTVGGGYNNTASGPRSTIPGGTNNIAAGEWSFAAGHRASADHERSFVWGGKETFVYSDTISQFKIAAQNGVSLSEAAGGSRPIRLGDLYRDNLIVAWGSINADGTILAEFGVSSISHTVTGQYRINLDVTANSSSNLAVSAILEVDAIPNSAATARLIYANMFADDTFDIFITNGSHVAVDNQFTFIVTAR